MESKNRLQQYYSTTRTRTEALCKPLHTEDYLIQAMDDVSPPKWHLAHTTWFFETFILKRVGHYKVYNPLFEYLFNSYYKTLGSAYPRARRGILARPTVAEVYKYRKHVDNAIYEFIEKADENDFPGFEQVLALGLNHEQQHQELLLMDIKYNFFMDPGYPSYLSQHNFAKNQAIKERFVDFKGGIIEIGHGNDGFCFDNELPRHACIIRPFSISNRLVTNAEYLEFINDKGYQRPELWLDDGWALLAVNKWNSPLYWKQIDGSWAQFTLHGLEALNPDEPLSHISYYEADAYARWKDCRLPTEFEWEYCTKDNMANQGNFIENAVYHPLPVSDSNSEAPQQLFGDLWEWTSSPYMAYPGYRTLSGALGEYNGKFMNNQIVLRGGSCVTPQDHIRASYRNFFQQDKRWQFSGMRLAKDTHHAR